MASDGFIVLDKRRSIFNLILLIVSGKTELHNIHHDDEDCILAISTKEKLRLEDAKLTLYLFYHHCNNHTKEVTIENYLKVTGRTMNNKDSIRRSIKCLSNLRIIYLNHNGKREEERLFEVCKAKRGKIVYRLNSFFESKLKVHGRGHTKREIEEFVFRDGTYRSYRKNSVRLIVMLCLMYCLDDSDVIDRKTLDQEKKNIQALLDKHFDNQNSLFPLWINQSCKEFLKQYHSL